MIDVRAVARRWRADVIVLAMLAYIPALTAAPGRMPTDTKLYLYLNPGRLIGDAASTWDNRQFLGWVPHQMIAYLWPSGPWYWFFDKIGVPDWVAQRLWIATLLFLGGMGVRWAARHLGLNVTGAITAAVVYQLSPYVLPYISRTSVMLLPWAAVGWITGLTVRAATRSKWRDPALIALVVLTVGAVNATALAMIVPAPLLWLVHAAWQRTVTWRRAVLTALRVGVLSVAVSLWWIMMLLIQGKYGADVLAYSETLDAVSFTSLSTETLRGLGYWLMYVRDPFAFTTTSAVDYMASGRVIFAGFALLVVCITGLAVTRWVNRRYALLLVFCGIVLAVGVHPINDPAPLVKPLSSAGLTLALRSSTRAIPLSMFGLALGAGALVTAVASIRLSRGSLRVRWQMLAPLLIVGLAMLNLPALWNHGFIDPALERDENPPAAWSQAAAALDASSLEARVLQLPGQEFGAFRWGYTVDPPLPGMTAKPLATRDLLPLGSPGAMDLLYAFDDRIQTSTVEPASIAPVARLLGADTIWLSNDIAFDRFRTARPELLAGLFEAGVAGIGSITSYGTPVPNVPQVPMIDETALSQRAVGEALPPVQLAAVKDPVPMIRASSRLVVLAGSGDGVVDAAASGLLHGDEAVIYAADVRPSDDLAAAGLVVVTDSNRDRAHLWNGSQDVVGFTESGGANGGVLRHSDSDQRLPVFPAGTVAQQTTATLETGMVVRASAYGEPFAYRPEQRPAMAVDGDPDTAWVVADRADPVGEYLEVSPIDGHLTLLQPQHTNANRMITAIRISSIGGAGAPIDVVLGQASLVSPGQQVDGLPTGKVRITITAVGLRSGGTDSGPSAVGFAELGVGPNREVVHVPTTALGKVPTATPMAIVLTRLRTDPLDRWRSDPEPTLVRQFDLPTARTVQPSITLRVDHRAADSVLATLTGHSETIANRRLTGDTAAAGWYATDGDPSTAWTSPFADVVGSSLTLRLDPDVPLGPLTVHQTIDQNHSIISNVTVTVAGQSTPITVPPPDSSGASMLTLPALHGESMTLTITGIDARSTIDRRFGEPTILPVAITEIGGSGLAHTTAIPAGGSCRTDLVSVDGKPLGVTVTADDVKAMTAGAAVTVQPCDAATLQLEPGSHLVVGANGLRSGIDVDRVVLSEGTPAPATAGPTVTVQRTRTTRTATVAACPGGCWLIFGEGYNSGWTATAAGRSLGAPRQIAGGFNGWWLAPSSTATTVAIAWKAQGGLNLALTASAIGVLLCLLVVWRGKLGKPATAPPPPQFEDRLVSRRPLRESIVVAGVLTVAAALAISWSFGVVGAALGIVVVVTRRTRLLGVAAAALAGALGLVVLWRETVHRYFVNAGWTSHFEDLHRYGLLVVVLLLASAFTRETLGEAPGEPPSDAVTSAGPR